MNYLKRRPRGLALAILSIAFGAVAVGPGAHASVLLPETRLAQSALSETLPTAFAPYSILLDWFSLERVGGGPADLAGIQLDWVPGSLEWVRVNDVLVVPRARLRVRVASGARLEVEHAGFTQSGSSELLLPVALLSGERAENSLRLRIKEASGKTREGVFAIRFRAPPAAASGLIGTDASCSRFELAIVPENPARYTGWIYAGCRLVEVKDLDGSAASLEIHLLWDGVPGATALRLIKAGPESGETVVAAGSERVRVSYRLPTRLHHAYLGAGIGPYHVHFDGGDDSTEGLTAMLTLYSAYAFTETMRVVAFDALTFNQYLPTDLGFYFSSEQVRTIDRRLSINLMLGVHFTGFRSRGQYFLLPGAPQGLEVIGYDILKRNHNLVVGAFVYPEIGGKEYYNFWLRWGPPGLFGEFNFISWKEKVNEVPFQSRSIGVSVGFPLARFL